MLHSYCFSLLAEKSVEVRRKSHFLETGALSSRTRIHNQREAMTTDAEWKDKCKLLKKKILQVEEASRISTLAIARGRVAVNRLRLEYSILLERLENKAVVPESDSEEEEELEITEGKKTIKRKKAVMLQPRDPDLPKRPLNPYLM